eukprot:1148650-Pelagomonas_calceolata.AAC.8
MPLPDKRGACGYLKADSKIRSSSRRCCLYPSATLPFQGYQATGPCTMVARKRRYYYPILSNLAPSRLLRAG